jgi:putative transposase
VKGRFLCATRLRQGELVEPYEIIEAEEANFPVALMCRQLSVSRSGYYRWKTREPSQRQKEDIRLKVAIKASHEQSRGTYGSPRIVDDLKEQGFDVSRRRVARLMAEEGITGTPKKPLSARRIRSTALGHCSRPSRAVSGPARPNRVWGVQSLALLSWLDSGLCLISTAV